jgi:REP element-mobilizing transposase RayT
MRWSAALIAYCLMPDHVHVLVEVPENVSLKDFARYFKQVSGYALKQHLGMEAWQISYYDHILRKEENLLDAARYIWDNPIKEGIVGNRADYALSGPRELMEPDL